jgi:hypothetical protein
VTLHLLDETNLFLSEIIDLLVLQDLLDGDTAKGDNALVPSKFGEIKNIPTAS